VQVGLARGVGGRVVSTPDRRLRTGGQARERARHRNCLPQACNAFSHRMGNSPQSQLFRAGAARRSRFAHWRCVGARGRQPFGARDHELRFGRPRPFAGAIQDTGRAMITLYTADLSGNGMKVRLLLSMLGLSYETRKPDMMKGEHKSPEFLKLNPLGQVPVLIDGDLTL